MTRRAIVLVMDSFGIGAAPDASNFGDEEANTLGNIAKNYPLKLPNLSKLGLINAYEKLHGHPPTGMQSEPQVYASYGYAKEISSGKDTISGHWEMMGLPVLTDWGYFEDKPNCFPDELVAKLCELSDKTEILGNSHYSGTKIIEDFGEEHIKTGKLICYTSADSNIQIAAHEEHFGLEKLYTICKEIKKFMDDKGYNICRVIARPFVGEKKGEFKRTGNRHDYATPPFGETALTKLQEKGGNITSIGKINDIFAGIGITKAIKATGTKELIDKTIEEIKSPSTNRGIIFTNFVNFDQDYGHRRDAEGYGKELEYFDTRIMEILDNIDIDDILFITADHGCDPTHKGTDHTREYVPILMCSKCLPPMYIGERETFADIAQTIARVLVLPPFKYGNSIF